MNNVVVIHHTEEELVKERDQLRDTLSKLPSHEEIEDMRDRLDTVEFLLGGYTHT